MVYCLCLASGVHLTDVCTSPQLFEFQVQSLCVGLHTDWQQYSKQTTRSLLVFRAREREKGRGEGRKRWGRERGERGKEKRGGGRR